MTVLSFSIIIFIGACFAGLIGALTGLGGGVIIIPLLSYLGIDLHYAIGTALVAVIATSSGSAAAYVKEGVTNMRIGMFLEIATTIGAVVGALLVASQLVPTTIVAIIFGLILILSAINSLQKKREIAEPVCSKMGQRFKLGGSYPAPEGEIKYGVKNVFGGFFMMLFAGILSGLLGIGAGAMKVIAMDNIMRVPFKVSTTTSNFMIGVTATAGACIYLQRGYIAPELCMPVVIGVLLGAIVGAKILLKSNTHKLRLVFAFIILLVAIDMIYKGFTGNI
ncbi:sulfite exporter TauE/SafE family protein [Arachidicoccus soli]|uniref:Probable membrane transporter protein n=1 Tax=Arachidicoccus soli TaxID=2341117 RepID=A0A386HRE4_9BACT|nr:sulfite exporter TauE/SafE family protein [Arachidicoccus soli]AYD48528.1 sulfite exporter TauE/SafE family protein [Arachidicoccus soli]